MCAFKIKKAEKTKENKNKKQKKSSKIKCQYYNSKRWISRNALFGVKWLGLLFSLGDNIVYGFSDKLDSSVMSILSIIGCLSYPLLIYWAIETYHYYKNHGNISKVKKEFKQFLFLSCICEIPFNIIKGKSFIYPNNQNLLLTVAAGFLLVIAVNHDYSKIVEKMSPKKHKRDSTEKALKLDIIAILVIATALCNFEYGGEGLAFAALLDYSRKRKHIRLWQGFSFAVFAMSRYSLVYFVMFISFAIILIAEKRINTNIDKNDLLELTSESITYDATDEPVSRFAQSATLNILCNVFYLIQLLAIFVVQLCISVSNVGSVFLKS